MAQVMQRHHKKVDFVTFEVYFVSFESQGFLCWGINSSLLGSKIPPDG